MIERKKHNPNVLRMGELETPLKGFEILFGTISRGTVRKYQNQNLMQMIDDLAGELVIRWDGLRPEMMPVLAPNDVGPEQVAVMKARLEERWRSNKSNQGDPPDDLTIPYSKDHWKELMDMSWLLGNAVTEFLDAKLAEAARRYDEEDHRGNA